MAFEKDLGYLSKFFDNLEAHAATLTAENGQQLRAMMAEERTRWQIITALVQGQSVAVEKADVESGRDPKEGAPPVAELARPAPPSTRGDYLTVGALIRRS